MAAVFVASASKGIFGRQAAALLPKASSCFVTQHRDATDLATMKRGTGGRGSFSGIVATVFGATGFLGRYVVNRLGKIGSQVIIPYRCDIYQIERLRLCGDLGQILFFPFNLRDEEAIRKTVQYSNVVINLIGLEYETKNFKFHDVHAEGAQRLARISKECGVEKFIHFSHLNANKEIQKIWSTSQFLQSKYEGECAVRKEFPEAIIFKPADIHGDEDYFLNYFTNKLRWSVDRKDLGLWEKGEQTIKQPVFVSDVAAGVIAAIRNPEMVGKTIECVGAQRFYLADIVDYIIQVLRRDVHLRRTEISSLIKLRAQIFDKLLPYRPAYNLDKLEREGITDWTNPDNPTLEDLGIQLTPLDKRIRHQLYLLRRYSYHKEVVGEAPDFAPLLPAEHYQARPEDADQSIITRLMQSFSK